jgi:hypothetical protein
MFEMLSLRQSRWRFLGQMVLLPSYENFLSSIIALLPLVAASFAILRVRPLSSGSAVVGSAVFILVLANSLAPVIGTLLEGNPVIYELELPIESIMCRAVFELAVIAAFCCATSSWLGSTRNVVTSLSSFAGAGSFLSARGIWLLGLIGLAAGLVKILPLPTVVLKLLDGFGFVSWAPYILLLPPYRKSGSKLIDLWPLALFYLLQAGLSVAGNSRMGFVGPIATVGTAWLAGLLAGVIFVDLRWLRRTMFLALIGFGLLSQLADLSTAILIERAFREQRSAGDQLKATWDSYLDKDRLASYRIEQVDVDIKRGDRWKETYVSNPFLARFIQTKFDDNCLVRIRRFKATDTRTLENLTLQKIQVIFPGPILSLLKISIDKEFINSFSTGDLINTLGGEFCLGSRLTGSIPVQMYCLFGNWYVPITFLLYTCVLVGVSGIVAGNRLLNRGLSSLGLVIPFQIYTEITADGVNNVVGLLSRGFIEMLVIYGLMLVVIKVIVPNVKIRPGVSKSKKKRLGTNRSARRSLSIGSEKRETPLQTNSEIHEAPGL